MTNLTTGLVTDCHLFIFIQVRFASAIGKPALIIIRWNFAGFFHFFNCIERSRLRMNSSSSRNIFLR